MLLIELMWFSTATRNFPSKQAQGSNGLRSYVQLEGLLRIKMSHSQNSGQTTWHLRKTRLSYLAFLSESLISDSTRDKIIVVAGGFEEPTMVKTNSETLDTTALECTHEEADTRIIVHCIHSSAETVVVSARDTDVLLLLLAHFSKMKCKQIWMKSGTFAKPQYIPVQKIWENIPLEDNVMETILPFHANTGCDSVSYLSGHTKETVWEVFEKHHQLLKDLGHTTCPKKAANAFDRVDVVFDRYQEFSIKIGTRVKRTKKLRPIRRLIENKDVPLPKQWPDYMASEENKAELSCIPLRISYI